MADDDPWCHERKYTSDEQMIYCMQMPLDFTATVPMFLWKDWQGGFAGAVFLSIFMALVIEFVPFIRWYIQEHISSSTAKTGENDINKSDLENTKAKSTRAQ